MRVRSLLLLSLTIITLLAPGPVSQVAAQYRVQETPALNGLGMFLFKDIELRVDGGAGNTNSTLSFEEQPTSTEHLDKVVRTQWYTGVFIDKPILAHFLEMAYDCEFWQRDILPRDTPFRDLFLEPIRLVAWYRKGDFHVSGNPRREEFYIGGRYSLDLGRIFRHLPVFQK